MELLRTMITWQSLVIILLWATEVNAQSQKDLANEVTIQAFNDIVDAYYSANATEEQIIFERRGSESILLYEKAEAVYERAVQLLLLKLNKAEVADIDPLYFELIQNETQYNHSIYLPCLPTYKYYWCSDECFHSRYRNIDGTCNNLKNPLWGSAIRRFNRLLPANYENKFNLPRGWTKGVEYYGFPLPSPRLVSTEVISTSKIKNDKKYTHMLMQWGQFLDHDLDLAPLSICRFTLENTTCSTTCENQQPCFPIPDSPKDGQKTTSSCREFTRSSAACEKGKFSGREQINEITSYMDASNVYGSSWQISYELRDKNDNSFLLKGDQVPGKVNKYFLPFDNSSFSFSACDHDLNRPNTSCFFAGDARSTEQPALAAMHTLWFREHNRIAATLKRINPNWPGETVYQEARKIVGAQVQVITYQHWLPLIVGKVGMKMLGGYSGYNPNIDATIINSFATSDFRFGHGLVKPEFQRLDRSFNPVPQGPISLHKSFFAPHLITQEGGIDPFIRGLLHDPAKILQAKHIMNDELTESLFKLASTVPQDLASLNIQRGRDHGLPTYAEMREYCGLGSTTSFKDLEKFIKKRKVLRKLEKLYGDPRNIDQFVGGMCEKRVRGARVGPLIMCVLVEQFRRLRDGDRFFYGNPGVFTSDQLSELRKTSLARIICDNSDGIYRVQPNVFRVAEGKNDFDYCYKIPAINLYAWREGGCPGYPRPPRASNYDPSQDICCCGTIYRKNPAYKCCGKELYDPNKDSCCDGVLYCGKPELVYTCCGKSIFNSASDTCINGLICKANETRFCGSVAYNSRTHICCGGVICVKVNKRTTCCGTKAYTPPKQICCDGFVRKVLSRSTQCCHGYSYDPNKEVCCPNTTGASPIHQRVLNPDDVDKYAITTRKCMRNDGWYGVENRFDFIKQTCCCGQIHDWPFSKDYLCCGSKLYNIWDEICCNGTVNFGNPKYFKCCGNQAYNPSKQSCCDTNNGMVVVDCVGGCPVQGVGECNGHPYDVLDQLCCHGNLFEWSSPYTQCCNDTVIDCRIQTCCTDSVCKLTTLNKDSCWGFSSMTTAGLSFLGK